MTSADRLPSRTRSTLGAVPALARLPRALLDDLAAIARVASYGAGQTVSRGGDAAREEPVGCVCSGTLRLQRTFADGRQHITAILTRGDLFHRQHGMLAGYSLEAATDASVLLFRHDRFEALLNGSQELREILHGSLLAELDRARDLLTILSSHGRRGRVAAFLLMLCARHAGLDEIVRRRTDRIEVRLPVGRVDMANLLGMRSETISRALHRLARSGSIRLLRPDLIEIRDLDQLAGEAGDGDLLARARLRDPAPPPQRRV